MVEEPADKATSPAASVARRGVPPVVAWLLVAVAAGAAFVVAFAYAGGAPGVLDLLGTVVYGGQGRAVSAAPGGSESQSGTASGETTALADLGGLPVKALRRMYVAQIESQSSITALVENRYSSLVIGTPQIASEVATVPMTVHLRGGGTVSGTMTLERFNRLWYVFGLAGTKKDVVSDETLDPGYDPVVVSVITAQQSTPENQDAFDAGVLGGGFTKITVLGVVKGEGTASVNVRFSGGRSKPRTGRFLCISKRDSATDYWFIARLAAN